VFIRGISANIENGQTPLWVIVATGTKQFLFFVFRRRDGQALCPELIPKIRGGQRFEIDRIFVLPKCLEEFPRGLRWAVAGETKKTEISREIRGLRQGIEVENSE
jgi:hypothetical protein